MKVKAFLFDCDGTVLDTEKLIMNAWSSAVHALAPGVDVRPEDVIKHFGRTLEEIVPILAKQYGVEKFDLDDIHKAYWEYHNCHHNEIAGVFPTVKEALAALKEKGALIGIVTSGEYSSCHSELVEFGIDKYFDVIVGAEVDEPKPSPKPALICCQKLGVKPEEAIMIGDSRHDIACGNRAGCKTAMVSWTQCDVDSLSGDEKPDIILDDAMQLIQYI